MAASGTPFTSGKLLGGGSGGTFVSACPGGASGCAAWNPSSQTAGMTAPTYSNNNRTTVLSTPNEGEIQSTLSCSAAKCYFELTINTIGSNSGSASGGVFGVANNGYATTWYTAVHCAPGSASTTPNCWGAILGVNDDKISGYTGGEVESSYGEGQSFTVGSIVAGPGAPSYGALTVSSVAGGTSITNGSCWQDTYALNSGFGWVAKYPSSCITALYPTGSFTGTGGTGTYGFSFNPSPTPNTGDTAVNVQSWTTGDVASVLLDVTDGTVEVWHNCHSRGVMFTGITAHSSTLYAQITPNGTETLNAGQAAFHCSVPSGYQAGLW